MENATLQVAGFLDNSTVNGPGIRSVIFLSGCYHNCEGCQNACIQSPSVGDCMKVSDLVTRVKENLAYINGVTISGGEPFLQDFTSLVKELKNLGLNVWVYTGYTYEELLSLPTKNIKEELKYIDVIVDGKFDINLTEGAPKYAGSTNQTFVSLENGHLISRDSEYKNLE